MFRIVKRGMVAMGEVGSVREPVRLRPAASRFLRKHLQTYSSLDGSARPRLAPKPFLDRRVEDKVLHGCHQPTRKIAALKRSKVSSSRPAPEWPVGSLQGAWAKLRQLWPAPKSWCPFWCP